jgi:fibronectin type 3 domain-containing protein
MTRKQAKLVNAVPSVKKSHSNRIGRHCQFEMLESRTLMSAAPPLAPTALAATAPNTTGVTLQWKDPASAVSGYDIFRSTDNVHFLQVGAVSKSTAASYTDKFVTSGQQYEYEVKSYGPGGTTSNASNVATVATPLAAPIAISAVVKNGSGGSSVQVTWKNAAPSMTGCYVLRSTDGGTFVTIGATNSPTITGFTDSNITAGHVYAYEIIAYNAVSTSSASKIVCARLPLPLRPN